MDKIRFLKLNKGGLPCPCGGVDKDYLSGIEFKYSVTLWIKVLISKGFWGKMLIGEYTHTIDAKKRLAIPSKLRKELGIKAVITRGLDSCLFIFPLKEWQKLVERLSSLPFGEKNSRSFVRLILAGASEVGLDSLGRVLIPDYLKNYAQLKKNVIIAGVYNRLEVWDKTRWEMFKQQSEKEVDNMAERLGELGV